MAALGATLVSGFELVADRIDLAERIEGADLVITGEGLLDAESFNGKVVGGVVALAREAGVPAVVLAGNAEGRQPVEFRTLVDAVGEERAWAEPLAAVEEVVAGILGDR